jgi:hypothetical protein
MKKFFVAIMVLAVVNFSKAQDVKTDSTTTPKKVRKSNGNSSYANTNGGSSILKTSGHPADHFLIQFGSDSWTNKPASADSGSTNGGRHFNIYYMIDKPFKTNPKYSVAYGVGLGTSNIYFKNSIVDIKSGNTLQIHNAGNNNRFDKLKVTEIFLEIPVELRYNFNNPNEPSKSWKMALGAKVGTLLKSYTKGKNLVKSDGSSVYGPTYIEKEYSKKFFNSTRLTFTGRVGYGMLSLNAAYTITPVAKSGFFATEMNTFSLGLCISGL